MEQNIKIIGLCHDPPWCHHSFFFFEHDRYYTATVIHHQSPRTMHATMPLDIFILIDPTTTTMSSTSTDPSMPFVVFKTHFILHRWSWIRHIVPQYENGKRYLPYLKNWNISNPTTIHCNNTMVADIAANAVKTNHSFPMEICYFWVIH